MMSLVSGTPMPHKSNSIQCVGIEYRKRKKERSAKR